MKFIMKKMVLLIIAIVCTATIYSGKVHAISISLELSGDGIQNANGIYLCTKRIPVEGTLNVKAELVTRNDMHVEGTPTGETSRDDVTLECEWKSSDEKVAKVENGIIRGVAEGGAEITVTYNKQDIKFSVFVGEEVEIGFGEHIYITQKDEIKTMQKGDTLQLDIYGIETLSNIKNEDVTWSSSNEKVATIDSNGLVTSTGVGKVTIKAEYGSYSSTYEIDVKEESHMEPPIDIIDDTYDFFSNKEQITINVGSNDKVEITAKLKEGLSAIQLVEMAKDNWDVEWKIEDETIAKCLPEKGIENNIYGVTQVAGRATIQGLKSGTTKLLIKVKVSTNRVEEFEIPIIINEVEKEKDDDKKEDKKEDNTIADEDLPKTGEKDFITIVAIGISIVAISYLGIKLKNKF